MKSKIEDFKTKELTAKQYTQISGGGNKGKVVPVSTSRPRPWILAR